MSDISNRRNRDEIDDEAIPRTVHSRWIGGALGGVLVLLGLLWFVTRESLPTDIQIATGKARSQYHRYGEVIGKHLRDSSPIEVRVDTTTGSKRNRQLLLSGEAHLGVIAYGTTSLEGLVAVAPLYHSVVQVVVRRDRGIGSIQDLAGKKVAIGDKDSGDADNARVVLDRYGVKVVVVARHFEALKKDDTIDAAIVTTGFTNALLRELLESGSYGLLGIDDAEALSLLEPRFAKATIPRGLYRGANGVPVPERSLKTVSVTSFLVAHESVSKTLIQEVIKVLYETPIRSELPTMISSAAAGRITDPPLHSVTRHHLAPYEGIGVLANLMTSVAAAKEVIFGVGAGIYLFWIVRMKLRDQRWQAEIDRAKEHLDTFLMETVTIERAQMETVDPVKLKGYLDDVTRLKLQALEQLTHEGLRSNRMFHIFLTQTGNLVHKIQLKIQLGTTGSNAGGASGSQVSDGTQEA